MMDKFKTLNNGIGIPPVGLGTYPMTGLTLTDAVKSAYNIGYRLIDTADNYYNEEDLGSSLEVLYSTTEASREELFLVSKVSDELYHPNSIGGGSNKGIYFWKSSPIMKEPAAVKKILTERIDRSLRYLKTDYLDLYLMHWPYPDFFLDIWHEMELIYKQGKVKAIGVCNCRERHLEKLKSACEIFPMVNQFETSPLNTKANLVEYCNDNNIQIMVYSPLMSLRYKGHEDYNRYLLALAGKYGKEKSQIILRYDIQRGLIPIPKSSYPGRLSSNFSVFDFELDPSEMETLSGFNIDKAYLPESKSCPGL